MTRPLVPRLAIAVTALLTVALVSGCSTVGAGTPSGGSNPSTAASSSSSSSLSGGGSAASADIDVCALLTVDQASSLVAKYPYSAATTSTIAPGQDVCTYANTGPLPDLVVIVYQPGSGVEFSTLTSAAGATTPVSGVGDKAASGDIELDVQAGSHLIAVQAAGGVGYGGSFAGAIAVAKAVIAALG